MHLLLALAALVLARPTLVANLIGTIFVAAGLGLRVWAAGVLDKGGGLCTDGPFRLLRHPLYLGSSLAAVGFAVMVNRAWACLLILALFILLYAAQVLSEERRLRQEFGRAHADYARRVPILIPRWAPPASDARAWQLRRALINREHYHLLVTCLLVALFYARHHWPIL
jgi:protein-S-isoprenylcysteine O-methyltransferase Ste14